MVNSIIYLGVLIISISTVMPLLVILVQAEEENPILTNEPFECGFEPLIEAQIPITIHFLLTGVLFLIFDIEVIIMIPLIGVSVFNSTWTLFWILFMAIMLIGLIMEILLGSLDWKIPS